LRTSIVVEAEVPAPSTAATKRVRSVDAVTARRFAALSVVSLVGIILVWTRVVNLGTSFWNDEAANANVIDRGLHTIFTRYSPNNHVLFSALTSLTTRVAGRVEPTYRLWSVLPALLAVPYLAWNLWRRFGALAGVTVVVLATVSPVHLVLVPQARGYGLAFAAASVMLVSASQASDTGRITFVVPFAVAGLIGTLTLPLFAISFVLQACVLLARPELRRAVALGVGAAGVISLVFYGRMLGQIFDASSGLRGLPKGSSSGASGNGCACLPWHGFASGAYDDLARPTVANFLPSRAMDNRAILLGIFLIVVALAGLWLWQRGDRVLLAHLVVPVVGSYLVFQILRFFAQPRYLSFLLAHVIVMLAIGTAAIWQWVKRVTAAQVIFLGAALVLTVLGGKHVLDVTSAQAKTPWENPKLAHQMVAGAGVTRVFTNSTSPSGLEYYFRSNIRVLSERQVKAGNYCFLRGPFALVDQRGLNAHVIDPKCLRARGAQLIAVPQQGTSPVGGRGHLFVWLVPAEARPAPSTPGAATGTP
jgi:hypothetical protein